MEAWPMCSKLPEETIDSGIITPATGAARRFTNGLDTVGGGGTPGGITGATREKGQREFAKGTGEICETTVEKGLGGFARAAGAEAGNTGCGRTAGEGTTVVGISSDRGRGSLANAEHCVDNHA